MNSHCVGESDGLIFCLARPEDYDDVMAISQDIYGGNDYLPHRYHSWMTEPGRVVIIARRDRKLVSDTRVKRFDRPHVFSDINLSQKP